VFAEVGLAGGAVVLGVHAVVHAERDQAAPHGAAQQADKQAAQIGHVGGRGLGGGVDLGAAVGADHVGGALGEGHHRGHHCGRLLHTRLLLYEGLLLWLLRVVRGLWGHASHCLGVARGSGGRRGGTEANRSAGGFLGHAG